MADGTEEARRVAIEKMEAARAAAAQSDEGDGSPIEATPAAKAKDKPAEPTHSAPKESPITVNSELKNVKIYSPFRVYYDGPANSLSAVNGTGPFDVLPGHKNFLSLLQECSLVVRNRRGEEALDIERGVLHVRDDKVTVFLDV